MHLIGHQNFLIALILGFNSSTQSLVHASHLLVSIFPPISGFLLPFLMYCTSIFLMRLLCNDMFRVLSPAFFAMAMGGLRQQN